MMATPTFLTFLLLSCFASTTSSSFWSAKIFILAEQINMSGRGGVIHSVGVKNTSWWDGVVPPQSKANPYTFKLKNNFTWEEAHEPLHKEYDTFETCGVGPGMAFANALLEHESLPAVIGLVPCAIGGTSIAQWAKGGYLYTGMVNRTHKALQFGGSLGALLWYQGESYSLLKETAELYKQNLEKFFTDVRADLEAPTLPIIQVALASGGKFKEEVRQAQKSVNLPNVRTVDAEGLELMPDNLHLTFESEVKVGLMLAEAFQQFEYNREC